MSQNSYSTLKVTRPRENVVQVEMNRPEKRNAMNKAFFSEIKDCFQKLHEDSGCRAVVLSGAGKIFSAGLDLTTLAAKPDSDLDVSRKAFRLRKGFIDIQESINVIEKCSKPVIAAVHSACVGGGVDLVSACDIRYCSADAWFQIKEVDVAIAADLGTLQRFPKITGNDSATRELAFSARKLYSEDARQLGFVSKVLPDRASLLEAALDTASLIATKSPVAVQGTKVSMVYSRDHTVAEGLEHIGIWNTSMVQGQDSMKAAMAAKTKDKAKFSKL